MLKKSSWLILLIVLSCWLTCCSKETTYQSVQLFENIQSIEIVDVKVCYSTEEHSFFNEISVQTIIEQEYWEELWEDILELPCERHFQDPPQWLEGFAVRIIYDDGSYEMFDADTVFYESAEGETSFPSNYFDEESFNVFISEWK